MMPMLQMMCKLANQQSAPEIDIDVFGENPLEFYYFMAVFDLVPLPFKKENLIMSNDRKQAMQRLILHSLKITNSS